MKTRKQLRPYATPAMDIVWLRMSASLLGTSNDGYGEPITEDDPGGWHAPARY